MIKKELLDILACPKCKGPVESDEEHSSLICRNCKLAYPVKDDIPIMLIDEATPLEEEN
ncbi:Trm112 family protein [Desulfogranum marinum]|uniref:Trm112 family protein n=1 Tax=Desulfogranum marinum TaxID=453220 RepID=UPI002D1E405F|nr:Trm112 family protein [Desulfogranum marinum]